MTEVSRNKRVRIDEFAIYDSMDGQPIHFRSDADELNRRRGGEDYGAVLVRLDVDADHNSVICDLAGSDVLRVLDRTLAYVTEVRNHYAAMVPADLRDTGQCMDSADWGRCKLEDGHQVEHKFPTEAEGVAAVTRRLAAIRRQQRSA